MSQAKTAPKITLLAAKRARIVKAMEDLKAKKLAIDAQLIALGGGRYQDKTGQFTCTVVDAVEAGEPSTVYVFPEDKDKQEQLRAIAGISLFGSLFDRKVVYTPCEAFAAVTAKLCSEAKAERILALCAVEVPGSGGKSAYVRA